MMRIFFTLLFAVGVLMAGDDETCYTVQLFSAPGSQENRDAMSSRTYPSSCRVMEIGSTLTVRCGCYEKREEANNILLTFDTKYKHAYVATSYKYRFEKEVQAKASAQGLPYIERTLKSPEKIIRKTEKKPEDDEEELKLILQVFLYQNDLEHAYETAKRGYKKTPNSYYWNQKMAEISQWSGKGDEAIKHMFFIYENNHDEKIQNSLIDYGLEAYKYEQIEPLVVEKALKNPSEENINRMLFVYAKIGSPEKAAAILESQYKKDTSKTIYLTKALQIYIDMGELSLAKKVIELIEEKKIYSQENIPLIAYFYYLKRDIASAYQTLIVSRESIEEEDVKYLTLLSDLGWYMQDFPHAAQASKKLMRMDEARFVDYERILFIYKNNEPELAAKAIREAYEKYKVSYLFYGYANSSMEQNNYEVLRKLIKDIDESSLDIKKESLYWVTKAEVLKYYKEVDKARDAIKVALSIDPDDDEIKLALFWFFMENNLDEELRMSLQNMSEGNNLKEELYLPMASAYFYLQEIDKAKFYTQKLLQLKSPLIHSLDFKFLQAYLYQSQNNEQAFKKEMQEIVEDLDNKASLQAKLYEENNHLNYYLRASIFTASAEKFEKTLHNAKKYLTEKNYNDIAYSWAIYNNAHEKSHTIFQKIKDKEAWMQFSNALIFQNHSEIENMLDAYLTNLNRGDTSQAAQHDGQIALSQTLAYEALETNSASQTAYIQHLSLSKEYSDTFDAQISHYNRDPLLQKYIKLKNSTYVSNAWFLLSELNYFDNSTLDENLLQKTPNDSIEADIGVRKLFERGHIEVHVGLKEAMRNYTAYALLASYQLSTDLKTNIGFEKNKDAQESTQLLLGGKKDTFRLELNWAIQNSTSIDFLYEFNDYSSQDEVELGSGNYGRISATQALRYGYPDISWGIFYDYGVYNETEGSRGVIDELQTNNGASLPANFYNMGASLSYGMVNNTSYTRAWRPYFTLNPYYSGQSNGFNFGFDAGYGGKLWHQDHLVLGAGYTESVNGVGGSILELFLRYKFLYP
ncbi:tetratricopeptide repeat protein [bacterium]|nr:tetratricopeptide repeat protein [bacterium]MBU1995207.1 tetratricopeptide repeat protein [bacterium]